MSAVETSIATQFEGKAKAVDLNVAAARAGFEWAAANLPEQDRFRVRPGDATAGKIFVEGNRAGALGAIFGGVQVIAWYPITPSSSLPEATIEALPELRRHPETGEPTYAVIQAEDELAALGMVIGAGWTGARALTATSGPGISLMAEFAGLAYFTETPAVVVDVQRMGPSTGLPTRTSQGDVTALALLSHGDTRHPVLFPAGPREYFAMTARALNLAQRLQTVVFVAADLDLGMNWWIDDPFEYPDGPLDHGKVLSAEDLERIESFGRYRDVDGDGIPYRTLPGNPSPKAAFFTRGSGHDEDAGYSEAPEVNVRTLERLRRKIDGNLHLLPAPVIERREGARVGVIAYGTSHWAVAEAREILAGDGVETSYLRLRSWPPGPEVLDFIAAHERVYVVEQNRDGQLTMLLRADFPELAARLRSVCSFGGLSLPVEDVVEGIAALEKES
jgi:Pyruvate:ferredoxin oxidoreductase and related 2-oxoacid:ferredoxin oxidoreductases, alpha subunit